MGSPAAGPFAFLGSIAVLTVLSIGSAGLFAVLAARRTAAHKAERGADPEGHATAALLASSSGTGAGDDGESGAG